MPFDMKIDGRQAKKRLQDLKKKVGNLTSSRCDITPTKVLYIHCDTRNEKLLEKAPKAFFREVRKRWTPKVEKAVKDTIRSKQPIRDERIAKAWRYGAYVYTERLWLWVKRGAWGKVEASTAATKASVVKADKAALPPRKPRTPQTPEQREASRLRRLRNKGKPKKKRAPRADVVSNYGVRRTGRGRRWYDIQKGKQKHGEREGAEYVETKALIEVFMRNRRIGTG